MAFLLQCCFFWLRPALCVACISVYQYVILNKDVHVFELEKYVQALKKRVWKLRESLRRYREAEKQQAEDAKPLENQLVYLRAEREWLYAKVYALQTTNAARVNDFVNKIRRHAKERMAEMRYETDAAQAEAKQQAAACIAEQQQVQVYFSLKSPPFRLAAFTCRGMVVGALGGGGGGGVVPGVPVQTTFDLATYCLPQSAGLDQVQHRLCGYG